MYIVVFAYLSICIAIASIECVDNQCKHDAIKTNLLSWYSKWLRGFEVDYITINELRDSYDFIVVGAGIGGSVVAHRLAMDTSYPKVLLLEAGRKHNTSGLSNEMIPILAGENQGSDIDWSYVSEASNDDCCDWYKERRVPEGRGKVAGGSSVLNYMMWLRGHKQDWDVLFNIDEWKWNDLLPYFKKTESLHSYNNKQFRSRGYDGPIIIKSGRDLRDKNSIFDESLLNAFIETNKFKYLVNGQNSDTGCNVGVGYTEYNIDDNGQRNNAFLGYNKYLRIKYKKQYDDGLINLDILTNAHVTKILFDNNNNDDDLIRAKAVQFADLSDNKKLYTINLSENKKSEIILGGGAINTPQILMLSGLGPSHELNRHKIKIIRDIPGVGDNLQNHVMIFNRYNFKPQYESTEAITAERLQKILTNFTLFKEYLFEGKGILSGTAINAFIRSNVMNEKYGTKHKYPDLQFLVVPALPGTLTPLIDYECGKYEYHDKANMMTIMSMVILQHPESKGWIKLKSSNPFEHALIQPNYLKEQFDVDSLMEGYKIMNNVMLQPSMKRLWDKKVKCDKYGDITDEHILEQYIRDSASGFYHQVGTCKMGDINKDKMAVVDNQLLVRGTANLRIADASIYPHQTSGNTQAPTNMVGEKASDIILKKWNS